MALRIVTPPSGGLIDLADAKRQCRVDVGNTDDDDLLGALILAASGLVEAQVQRRYLAQTLEWVRDRWDDPMILPVASGTDATAMAVQSIKYVDLNGEQQTLPTSIYWARPYSRTLAIIRRWYQIWPWAGDAAARIVIRFAITGGTEDVPDVVKHAVRLLVSHFYQNRDAVVGVENRDSSSPLPLGVDALLAGEKWN